MQYNPFFFSIGIDGLHGILLTLEFSSNDIIKNQDDNILKHRYPSFHNYGAVTIFLFFFFLIIR